MAEIINLLTDYTFLTVAIGTGLLGFLSGLIGVYVVVKKQGLICDAISHSTLPGVCIAFMLLGLTGRRRPSRSADQKQRYVYP